MSMMRVFPRTVAFALCAMAASAQAALPPYWQRAKELTAILESSDVARELDEAPITRIETTGEDRYRVSSGNCAVDVQLIGTARSNPGPRLFDLRVGKRKCAK
ncbi:hypothetical protein [Sphingomonas sp.]|uniref:hypothetical protein n=1 Tax=Sphingomonas sp. TaxID=28214 RepID=UPI003D6D4545